MTIARWRQINRFSKVQSILIEYCGMHFEIQIKDKTVWYRHVISPRDGGRKYPEGYFEEKHALLSKDDISQIAGIINQMSRNYLFESDVLAQLPYGASRDALMKVMLKGDIAVCYTNTHEFPGFSVRKDPVSEEFIKLVNLLESKCSFPEDAPESLRDSLSDEILKK